MHRLIALIFACAVLGAAAQEVSSELASVRGLQCKFGGGTRTTWASGEPKTSEARLDNEIVFDSVDLAQGTVRVLASVRIGNAHVAISPVGMFVLDARPGVIDMTTIFPSRASDGNYAAVLTRQLSGPTSEQYFGTCKPQR
jgi:hypothetical protein